MNTSYDFGKILLSLREKSGLTQDQLAKRLGLKNSTISKYETSSTPPPALMVRKIAKEFGVSSDYILGLEISGTLSLLGLSDEQTKIITDLADLFKQQNISVKQKISARQFELLGRITANFLK